MSDKNAQYSDLPESTRQFLEWLRTDDGKANTEYLRNEATEIDEGLVSQVGQDIRDIHERLGINRTSFAEMLGIEVGYLIFIENGLAPFSEANNLLKKAQDLFGATDK